MNYTLRIFNLGVTTPAGEHAHTDVDLRTASDRTMRALETCVLDANGGGNTAKQTANAMYDMDCIRTGALPFTRNGFRFTKLEASA